MLVVMARAYSKDLREKIVEAYETEKETIEEIAYQFKVSKSSVYKYLRLSRTTGDLSPRKTTGRPKVYNEEIVALLNELIFLSPDARLIDYSIDLEKKTGIKLSITTIWEICKKLGIRRKKRVFMRAKESLFELRTNG